jgi:hypothetical protein
MGNYPSWAGHGAQSEGEAVPADIVGESPAPLTVRADVPGQLAYRLKRRLPGPAFVGSRLSHERSSKGVEVRPAVRRTAPGRG